jgi:hypothetical protein
MYSVRMSCWVDWKTLLLINLQNRLMLLNLHQWNRYLLETLLIPCIVKVLWKPEVNYCVQNSLTTVPRLSNINIVHSFSSFSFHINFKVNLHSRSRVPKGSLLQFSQQNPSYTSLNSSFKKSQYVINLTPNHYFLYLCDRASLI